MADFDPPFANSGEKRLPNTTEREQGFPCGPADQRLFNAMFNRIESEIGEVITHAGITQSDSTYTQLREAIVALIAAATGGGETEEYLLLAQATSRLPVFPEIMNVDGKLPLSSPGTGTVRIPGGNTIQHRGIARYSTALVDLVTVASKTYHLRWTPTGGASGTFVLKDLADVAYNPTAAPESHAAFDSTFDDMLVARVVTNSSNIPTMTSLVNMPQLWHSIVAQGAASGAPGNPYGFIYVSTQTYNWARTPKVKAIQGSLNANGVNPAGTLDGGANIVTRGTIDRYSAQAQVSTDWQGSSISGPYGVLAFDFAA